VRRCHVEHTDSSIDIDIVWRTIRRVSQGVCWPFFVLWPIRSPCFSRSLPEPYLEAGLKKAIPAIMDQLSGKVPGDLPRHGSHDFYRCFSPTQNSFCFAGETHDDSWTTSIAACHVKSPIPAADRAMIGATEWCCHVKFVTISSSPQAIRLIKQ